jgi:hypothetical protein
MGKQVGKTRCERKGEVDDEEDKEEEEIEEDKNDILIRDENKFKGHSQRGYFTGRHCFLGMGRKERVRKLPRDFDFPYSPLRLKKHVGDYFQVPKYFLMRDNPSMRLGTIFGQGSPCERRCDQLCILPHYL